MFGKNIAIKNYSKMELKKLFENALDILKKEKNLVKINKGYTIFVGDTHGDIEATKIVIDKYLENCDYIVFLGDYVDREDEQIKNINYILSLKVKFPEKIILLRGNHETPEMNYIYGFRNKVLLAYNKNILEKYHEVFSFLPIALITENRIFALHGGIADGLNSIEEINSLPRGQREPENFNLLQLLWNDPREGIYGFHYNDYRGAFYYFGKDVFEDFIKANNINMIIRSHEVYFEGYSYFFNKRLLTISTYKKISEKQRKIAEMKNNSVKVVGIS